MLFSVKRYESDLCGNIWYHYPDVFVEAESQGDIEEVIRSLPKFFGGYEISTASTSIVGVSELKEVLRRQNV